MPFIFDHTRTLSEQLEEIGVDRDTIIEASDYWGRPETELVQFWLDLYGSEGLHTPTSDDPGPNVPDWDAAVRGYCQEDHSAEDILEVMASLGTYDPDGEYGGREEDAACAAVIIAERNAPPEA